MKIGIMSMQRIENYGSFLQAYSLKHILEELGHEVCFVDYTIEPCLVQATKPQRVHHSVSYRMIRKIYYKIKNLYEIISGEKASAAKLDSMRLRLCYKDYVKELGVTEIRTENENVDVLIIGSDEVFNCLQENPAVGYSKQLFGQGVSAKKVITYAASAGFTTVEKLEAFGIKDEVANMIKNNFSCISVRDDNTYELVKSLTHISPKMHLDPVLVGDFQERIIEKMDLEKYVVVYSYEERMSDRFEEADAIQKFAHERDLKTVSIGNFQKWTDLKIEASPFELLGYIKNADFVVTDTFHGTIFSIVLKKQFATIVRESNEQKLSALLKTMHLENRRVSEMSDLEHILLSMIDYSMSDIVLKSERDKSIQYLEKAIKLTCK